MCFGSMCFRGERLILCILTLILCGIIVVNRKSYAVLTTLSLTILPAQTSSSGNTTTSGVATSSIGGGSMTSVINKNTKDKPITNKSGYIYLTQIQGSYSYFKQLLTTASNVKTKTKTLIIVPKETRGSTGYTSIIGSFSGSQIVSLNRSYTASQLVDMITNRLTKHGYTIYNTIGSSDNKILQAWILFVFLTTPL